MAAAAAIFACAAVNNLPGRGKVRGGGPLLQARTGSGNINIQ